MFKPYAAAGPAGSLPAQPSGACLFQRQTQPSQFPPLVKRTNPLLICRGRCSFGGIITPNRLLCSLPPWPLQTVKSSVISAGQAREKLGFSWLADLRQAPASQASVSSSVKRGSRVAPPEAAVRSGDNVSNVPGTQWMVVTIKEAYRIRGPGPCLRGGDGCTANSLRLLPSLPISPTQLLLPMLY